MDGFPALKFDRNRLGPLSITNDFCAGMLLALTIERFGSSGYAICPIWRLVHANNRVKVGRKINTVLYGRERVGVVSIRWLWGRGNGCVCLISEDEVHAVIPFIQPSRARVCNTRIRLTSTK